MKRINLLVMVLMLGTAVTATAQKYGKTEEDSIDCVTNLFLYQEAFKNKQYEEAYVPWKAVLKFCPGNHKNTYIRGVVILKQRYNATKDPEERAAIVKELMDMYDLRIEYFGEAATVNAMKGYDCEQLRGIAGLTEYYPYYAEAMKQGGDQLKPVYIDRFFEATVRYVLAGNADTMLIIDNYDLASDALDKIMAKTTDSAALVEVRQVMGNVEAKFSPFASCEQLISIYTKKFEANPEDVNLLKKITTLLRKKGCTKSDLFFNATKNLHRLEPSPQTAMLMGQMCYNNDQFSEAVSYLNEAAKGMEEDADKYRVYLLMGMAYMESNSYSASRSAFMRAAEMNPNSGEPWRMIAQLYAKGHRAIEDGLGGRTAYWAAVDKARKAMNVDPSEENVAAAQKLINAYSGSFPKQSDAFMMDLIDGSSYTVPGWIGETTTVRTRK